MTDLRRVYGHTMLAIEHQQERLSGATCPILQRNLLTHNRLRFLYNNCKEGRTNQIYDPVELNLQRLQGRPRNITADLIPPGRRPISGCIYDLVELVVDFAAPLNGAFAALGVHEMTGLLTHARPARLTRILQEADGAAGADMAEGDGASTQLLDPRRGLLNLAADGTTVVPNPDSEIEAGADHIAQFALLGRILGISLLHRNSRTL